MKTTTPMAADSKTRGVDMNHPAVVRAFERARVEAERRKTDPLHQRLAAERRARETR